MNEDLDLKIVINRLGLSQINLNKKKLTAIPQKLFFLDKLETLIASENFLVSVPPQIGKLRKLKVIDLSHNKIRVLPEDLSKCINLVELYLNDNRIYKLSLDFFAFRRLRFVQLSDNIFEKLPANFGHIISLEKLDVSKNSLWCLPKSFSNLVNLNHLNLAENVFIDFPPEILSLYKLSHLDISHNKIHCLPPDLSSLKNLKRVNVAFNQFSKFPSSICDLKHMEYLDISNNHLKSISSRLSKLSHLKIFLVNNNSLTNILDNLPTIEFLNAANNAIIHLSVTNMKSLKQLMVSRNQLESVPSGVFDLPELEELHISENNITHLSQDVAFLKKLKRIDISGNKITLVPKALYEMQNLIELNLTGEFKKVRNGYQPAKRVAAYLVEPLQKTISKDKKITHTNFISKLFSTGHSKVIGGERAPIINDHGARRDKYDKKNSRPEDNDFYFSEPPQKPPKSIMKRSKSLPKTDDHKSSFSKQAWSDESDRRAKESRAAFKASEDFLDGKVATLKPYYEVEYPRSWLVEGDASTGPSASSSIRFFHPEDRPFMENFKSQKIFQTHGATSSTRDRNKHKHEHKHRRQSKSLERSQLSTPRNEPVFRDSREFLEFREEFLSSDLLMADSGDVGRGGKPTGRRKNDDDWSYDNLSTTVTINDEVGDTLSLGDDDFLFHPPGVADEKLLHLAQSLETLLGNQMLAPYSRRK